MLKLVGDVGGTNCRFALARTSKAGELSLSHISHLNVADFDNFDAALARYLSDIDDTPTHAGFALAGPKFDGVIKMTNVAWRASEADLKTRFGFADVVLANDFAAMARGAAVMGDDAFQTLISGPINYTRPVAVLGPGTGLGVAGVLPSASTGGPIEILSTEGGYTAFAPQDDLQIEILRRLMKDLDFVAAEHLLSGPGLLRIYRALCDIRSVAATLTQPSDLVAEAQLNPKTITREAVTVFCNILGGFAGNTAHTLGASGGVIIAGGVARHIAPFIESSDFTARFKARGRAAWFTQNIPVRLLTAQSVALYGAAALISDRSVLSPV